MAQTLNQSITHLLHRASQKATERFAKELGDSDLTARQLVVLAAIGAEDGLSQTDIVNATGIDRSTLADIARRLKERGLISRRRTKEDERAYAVTLTAAGRKALDTGAPVLERIEADLLATLPVKRRAELIAALGALAALE